MQKNIRKLSLGLAVGPFLFSCNAFAMEYETGLSVNANTSHNDNIQLTQHDKTAVTKYVLSPTLSAGANSETNEINLSSTLDFNRFNRSEFNSNDQSIRLGLLHKFEQSSLGLNADYIHNSTITSELLTSGRIGNKAERSEKYSVSPSWLYTINESNLIQITADYETQNYSSNAYTGYKYISSEFDWSYLIYERLKWITSITYSDYHSDDIAFNVPPSGFPFVGTDGKIYYIPTSGFGQQSYSRKTKNKGFQLGIDYQLTEQSLLQAHFGRSRNDSTTPINDISDVCSNATFQSLLTDSARTDTRAVCEPLPHQTQWLTTANVNWNWTGERQQFGLSATKSTQPSSNGYAVDALIIGSNWGYQLSERGKLLANLNYVRNKQINNNTTIQNINTAIADRNYGSAELSYHYQVSEFWYLSTGFQYSDQKYEKTDYHASSRVYSLGLVYQPQKLQWSR